MNSSQRTEQHWFRLYEPLKKPTFLIPGSQRKDEWYVVTPSFTATWGLTLAKEARAITSLCEITCGLLSLEESAKRLAQTCLQRLQALELDEVQPGVKTLRTLTGDRWKCLIGSVSKLALKLVKEEWEMLADTNLIDLGLCICESLVRYGLPCKHHLLQAYQTGQPFPRSLLHPRWWLDGPEIKIGKWSPSYAPYQELVLSPKKSDIAEVTLGLLEAREIPGPEAQSRLDATFIQSTTTILQATQRNDALAQLPIGTLTLSPKEPGKRGWPMD
jgi:hypothetical protein